MMRISLRTASGQVEDWTLKFHHSHGAKLNMYDLPHSITSASMARWPNGDRLVGFAECSPLDRFNKETGRKVALTKLLSRGYFTKGERTQIWEQYFNRNMQEFREVCSEGVKDYERKVSDENRQA